jgi:pimeloyl-[acyl-carrier protein] methyl ester esterase
MNELLETMAAQLPQVCTVLGWSLGGMVALAYASKYQERGEKLIMLASSAKFVQSSDWQHAQTEETLGLFIRGAKDNMSATIKRFVSLQTQGVKRQRDEAAVLKGFVVGAINESKNALISGLLILQNSDLRYALKNLNCPLLMMLGEKDQLVPKGVATDSMMINKGIQLCIIEGAAHVPFLSHPKESLRVLQQFMLSERSINDE